MAWTNVFMARLGRADEIVVGQLRVCGELPPQDRRQFIAICLRRFAFGFSGLLDLLPVLVQAGQEKDLLPKAALGTGDHVGDDLFIGMAEVRLAIDVVNRGRDVKSFAHRAVTLQEQRWFSNRPLSGRGLTRMRWPRSARPAARSSKTACVRLQPRRTKRWERWLLSPI